VKIWNKVQLILVFSLLLVPRLVSGEEIVPTERAKPIAMDRFAVPEASVTGHAFSKEKEVEAGDLVQWDILNTVGNQGVLVKVTDTLPEQLAFIPDSAKAIEFYLVNADGSIGDEITDQWKISVKGQNMTARPKDPMRYRYTDAVSETEVPTRFIYRIYSVVRDGVPSGQDFVNHESLFIENPPKVVDGKRMAGEVIELTSNAKVFTKAVESAVEKQRISNVKLPKAGDTIAGWTVGLGAAIIGFVVYLKRK
jgi:uncharacterized repeat protein (TIGR01451 family)/LPXTG-motif cell wall-anchored protein